MGVWVCLVFWCFGVLVVSVWMQAPAERRAVAPPEADEDEIEKALRKISKFVIFDLQKIVNSFAKSRTIAVKLE